MKWPKLKLTVLCQVLIYLPVLVPFIYCIVAELFGGEAVGVKAAIFVAVLFLLLFLTIVYLIHFAGILIFSDLFFLMIRYWKRDRLCYESAGNGTNLAQAERHIQRRCRRWGKAAPVEPVRPQPVAVYCRRCYSWTVFWKSIEKNCLIYRVERLDRELYGEILRSAGLNVRAQQHTRKAAISIDKAKRKASVAVASVVVILADAIDPELPGLAREKPAVKSPGYLLPCVADVTHGRYYFDGMAEPYMLGVMGRPEKNMALGIVKRLVFGGRLPLKQSTRSPRFPLADFSPDMSLWQFLKEMRQGFGELKREEKWIAKRLKPGEVALRENRIFAKLGQRTAVFFCCEDETDARRLAVQLPKQGFWMYPRRSLISKKDREELKKRISVFLASQGYSVNFDET